MNVFSAPVPTVQITSKSHVLHVMSSSALMTHIQLVKVAQNPLCQHCEADHEAACNADPL